ncbi:hypothetical protein P3T76_007825 [Phytophthora citrophthora]|uniref:RxLR effector protein n=1 Tax=Phytophthora citrophthora TaxID=4793 RepID=A0AAD9GMH2_9STRA|nr:hypothetical protein P3T76_007825 [Phytophthora citrophthora]
MRLHYALLFAFAVLFASINASVVLKQDSLPTVREMGTKRSLRTEEDTTEERIVKDFLIKIKDLVKSKKVPKVVPTKVDPKLTKAASIKVPTELTTVVAMPSQSNALQKKLNGLVKDKMTTDNAFMSLKLGDSATKLFSADALPMYVRFLEKSSAPGATNIYQNGVKTLLKHFPEKDLIAIVNNGLQSKNKLSFATADRLRAGLVSKWWSEGKTVQEITPLLKNGAKLLSDSNKGLVAKYMLKYNEEFITKLT